MKPKVTSKILDDARKEVTRIVKIHTLCHEGEALGASGNILALSGTTDIECPDEATGDPDFATKTRYKWKVSVVLENGELPNNPYSDRLAGELPLIYSESQQEMLHARYKQVVE